MTTDTTEPTTMLPSEALDAADPAENDVAEA